MGFWWTIAVILAVVLVVLLFIRSHRGPRV